MAKKSYPQTAALSAPAKTRPTVRLELPDGLPKNLPEVEGTVSLVIRGKLLKVAAKDADYNDFPSITVSPDSVKLATGKKNG